MYLFPGAFQLFAKNIFSPRFVGRELSQIWSVLLKGLRWHDAWDCVCVRVRVYGAA